MAGPLGDRCKIPTNKPKPCPVRKHTTTIAKINCHVQLRRDRRPGWEARGGLLAGRGPGCVVARRWRWRPQATRAANQGMGCGDRVCRCACRLRCPVERGFLLRWRRCRRGLRTDAWGFTAVKPYLNERQRCITVPGDRRTNLTPPPSAIAPSPAIRPTDYHQKQRFETVQPQNFINMKQFLCADLYRTFATAIVLVRIGKAHAEKCAGNG